MILLEPCHKMCVFPEFGTSLVALPMRQISSLTVFQSSLPHQQRNLCRQRNQTTSSILYFAKKLCATSLLVIKSIVGKHAAIQNPSWGIEVEKCHGKINFHASNRKQLKKICLAFNFTPCWLILSFGWSCFVSNSLFLRILSGSINLKWLRYQCSTMWKKSFSSVIHHPFPFNHEYWSKREILLYGSGPYHQWKDFRVLLFTHWEDWRWLSNIFYDSCHDFFC